MTDVMSLALEERARVARELAELNAFLDMAQSLIDAPIADREATVAGSAPAPAPKAEMTPAPRPSNSETRQKTADETESDIAATSSQTETPATAAPIRARAAAPMQEDAQQTATTPSSENSPELDRSGIIRAPEMDAATAWKTYMKKGQRARSGESDSFLFKTG
ncbi:MAG: hypothetical protein AAGI13_09485 [Pseudomonadota bacterium]